MVQGAHPPLTVAGWESGQVGRWVLLAVEPSRSRPRAGAGRPAAYHGRPDRRRTLARECRAATRDRGPLRRGPELPARPGVRGPGQRDRRPLRRGGARPRGLLGEDRPRANLLVEAVRHDARVGPAVREVVRRWRAEHRLQLRRPPRRERPGQQGRLPLDRRARRDADDHLRRPPPRGPEGGERAARSSASARATGSRSTCR